MEKLRINSGIKRIEVNDNGEYIEINLNDGSFFERYFAFCNWIDDEQAKIEEQSREIEEKYKDMDPHEAAMEIGVENMQLYIGLSERAWNEVEKVFGEGCKEKVFPDTKKPTFGLLLDFVDGMGTVIRELVQEENERFSQISQKYSSNRKGANSR